MTAAVVAVVISYLLGSVIGSLAIGLARGVDIRTQGSGNAGGTNALRTQGKWFALAVIVVDIGKGVLAAGPVAGYAASASTLGLATVQVWCAAAVVVGHVWPVFFGFRGGKGAATLVGVVAVIAPLALIPMLATFGLVLVTTGFVGLSTMVATASLLLWAAFTVPGGVLSPFGAFALAMSLFIAYTHRANIRRMIDRNENRFEKAMLLRRRR